MAKIKYILNPETLLYDEKADSSLKERMVRFLLIFLGSIALSVLYFFIAVSLGLELPKTSLLKLRNEALASKVDMMSRKMDSYDNCLTNLELRDNDIYRSLFALNAIPESTRSEGFEGLNRYDFLEGYDHSLLMSSSLRRMDMLTKKAYVQSKSYDEVLNLARRAGDMASCVPAIPPVLPDRNRYKLTSPFGFRSDPITGRSKRHTGMDFSMKPGNPVYATGDGVVESCGFEINGYGNAIVIDHGFGYKTRYAHLKTILVNEGIPVKRGEKIAESGNSGRSTGPHLHYEVLYKNGYINPYGYMDLDMSVEEFKALVDRSQKESEKATAHPIVKRVRR